MKTIGFAKRLLVSGMVSLILVLSTAQCFGGFALTKKLYGFNKSIMASNQGLAGNLVRTLVMWVMAIIPVYSIGMLIDLVVLNLIEFWTGNNLLSQGPDAEGRVTFTQINDNEMRVDIKDGKISSFYVFRDRPGEFFLKEGSSYIPVVLPEALEGFNEKGMTSLQCERTSTALVCSEGSSVSATLQSDIQKRQYEQHQYRAHLAMGKGALAASR